MQRRAGVTLIEITMVVAIVGLIAAISFPSVASGLESIQLRSAASSAANFLTAAMNRADRREQPMEVVVSPAENALILYSTDPGYTRRLALPDAVHITGDQPRQFLLLPGATPPEMNIDLVNRRGAHKLVHIDPVTGVPLT